MRGRCSRGGIFLPEALPQIDDEYLDRLSLLSFAEQAASIMKYLLPELPPEECDQIAAEAFREEHFGSEPLACRPLNPYLKEELILLAERGRSGHVEDYAAALTDAMLGLWSAEDEAIYLLSNGSEASARSLAAAVSGLSKWKAILLLERDLMQEKESEWERILNLTEGIGLALASPSKEIEKALFSLGEDSAWHEELRKQGIVLLEADECHPASWLAHLILLIASFASLRAQELPEGTEEVHISLPVSGLGFVLASLYAKGMGLPIGKMICNCSKSHPFSEFIRNGRYRIRSKRRRDSIPEAEERYYPPSLEALLFELSGRSYELLAEWLAELKEKDSFSCSNSIQQGWKQHLSTFYSDRRQTERAARQLYDKTDHLLDIGACMAYAGKDVEKPRKNMSRSVLIISGQNPYWTENFASAAIFSRSATRNKTPEDLRRMVVEEAGLNIPLLQERLDTLAAKEDAPPFQDGSAEQLQEQLFDLLTSDRRIS